MRRPAIGEGAEVAEYSPRVGGAAVRIIPLADSIMSPPTPDGANTPPENVETRDMLVSLLVESNRPLPSPGVDSSPPYPPPPPFLWTIRAAKP